MAATSKRRGARRSARSKGRVRQHLAPWARDALGIGLVVFALISVLALWFDAAGVVGRGVDWALHGAIGAATAVFPVLAFYWGVLLLRGTVEDDRTRMFIGFSMALIGALGLLSLWRDDPSPVAGWAAVEDAAGVLGAVAAWPLGRLLSEVGAAIVLAGLTVLGLLIFTGTPLASVGRGVADLFRRAEQGSEDAVAEPEPAPARRSRRKERDEILDGVPVVDLPEEAPAEPELEPIEVPEIVRPTPETGRYELPPIELLRTSPASAGNERDEEHTTDALERTFHTFGVPAHVRAAHRGPTVTLFEVEVEAGTKVNKVLSLADDIAYALATPDVRIIAPIPGKSAIGVEVPNRVRDFVMLGDILRSRAAKDDRHPLSVALGKDVHGRAQLVNLTRMPHLLIAGATGAGKSSLINSFITSILMRTTPDDVKLVLVDPKRVELAHFADLPHLLVPVIVHPKRAAEALAWVVREMEQRYELLAMVGVRDIDGYRQGLGDGTLHVPPGQEARVVDFPYLIVVIDELADLMIVSPRDVEDSIVRLAQMARAVGIHLVVATQRPSVDVVTGLIKANIPSRIALMTSSQADSRVILDMNGAEKLVGHGDLLFAPSSASKPTRLQAAWVTEKEIQQISDWIRAQREPEYQAHVEGFGRPPVEGDGEDLEGDDELLRQATELVIRSQLGSTSMLQRKLKVGFARAGRIMDLLEERGIVGPSLGSKARDVLVTPEEWEESRSAHAG
ncbi:MAG TPA: DNA translocase FtsK 4TM domain-containing protein [Actinomycetota bacterium]|nr:DNA translocase FtsK 4TM domain-containing protein [Actinomycetota bacterium]